jgi:hypothetical protein
VASSCYSLSLSFFIVKLANDYLIQNSFMFGINKRIGGWWIFFELFELLSYFIFLEITSWFLLLILWTSLLWTLRFYFSSWIERLISILHLWTNIYAFVFLFFIIYKSKATHLLMLFRTKDRNLENENP